MASPIVPASAAGVGGVDYEFAYSHPTLSPSPAAIAESIAHTRQFTLQEPHPLDQRIFGSQPQAPAVKVDFNKAPALQSLIEKCVAKPTTTNAEATTSAATPSTVPTVAVPGTEPSLKLRPLIFATPLTSASATAATTAQIASPPSSARGSARTGRPSSSGKSGASATTTAKPATGSTKKGKAGVSDVPVPTPEEALIASTDPSLILYIREAVIAREEFEEWKKAATETVTLPVATAPLSTVDTRLYTHLLNQIPAASVTIPTMLYSMFEQCAVHASGHSLNPAKPTPTAVDLNEFFAGETLNEVEEFMSAALGRVTFNAATSAQNGKANGWSTIDTEKAAQSSSTTPVLGGFGSVPSSAEGGNPFIKYDDELAIRRAECSLALGIPLIADSISLAAEQLIADFYPLPGVQGRGMPTVSSEEHERQSKDATALFQRATSSDNKISPAVFERALLLLELEEMLLQPAPAFKHTLHAALDASQATEVDVQIRPLPGGKSSASTAVTALPSVKSNRVKEKRPGCSLYHTAHARLSNTTVESAVTARLRELHLEAKEKDPSGKGFGPGFGLKDQTDANEDKYEWDLEHRQFQEELDARVLPQRLMRAMFSPSGTAHTQVRYRPMFDELLVTVHTPTPLIRQREQLWSEYFTPNLTLDHWLQSAPSIQRFRPKVLYNYADPNYTGKLAECVKTFFPADQGRLGVGLVQSGDHTSAYVFVEKDETWITMEKATIEVIEEAPLEVKEVIITPPAVVEEDESTATGGKGSRPSSRESGRKSGVNSARKGSAGSTKKTTASGSAAVSTAAKPKPATTPTASGGSAGGKGMSSSAKKKAQLEEQKELDELATLLTTAQGELDQARQTEAATEAALDHAPAPTNERILFSARFPDGTRVTTSGARQEGTQRVTYTTRTGLVVELRNEDEVYMKYPKSVLEGGLIQPIVSAGKRGNIIESTLKSSSTFSDTSSAALTSGSLLGVEHYRLVSPDGIIYRVNYDGAAWLFLPNGEVGVRRSSLESWIWTDNRGMKSQRQEDGSTRLVGEIEVVEQFDAESGATVVTREDLTMFITYANGSTLAQHADGSRIYTDIINASGAVMSTGGTTTTSNLVKPLKHVTIETPLFPSLQYKHSLRTDLKKAAENFAKAANGPLSTGVQRKNVVELTINFDLESSVLKKSSEHESVLFTRHASNEYFIIHPTGRVFYVPYGFDMKTLPEGFLQGYVDFDFIPLQVYDFNLNIATAGVLKFRDVEDNIFEVDCFGHSHMVLGRDRNLNGEPNSIPPQYYPLPSNPLQPRVFVVRKDGTGYELLPDEAVKKFGIEIECSEHVQVLPPERLHLRDPADERVSRKFLLTIPTPTAYKRHPVIPNVLRTAPSHLVKGTSLATLTKEDPLVVLHGSALEASPVAPQPLVVFRHLISTPHVQPQDKAFARRAKRAWADWKEEQERLELERLAHIKSEELAAAEAEEQARLDEELRLAREDIEQRAKEHADLVNHHELAISDPALAKVRSRPPTANKHRTPSSSALLPKPVHELSEGQQVVQQMVATLTAPPRTFFQPKKTQAPVNKEKVSRPMSVTKITPASVTAESFATFFQHPSFRRDFLIAAFLQRLTDLSSPFIQGSRERENDGQNGDDQQSSQEKEELWSRLDEDQRQIYQEQFESQVEHLCNNSLEFIEYASAFLNQPYDVKKRSIQLQEEPYLSLLEHGSPHFRLIVEQLASILGYEKENENLVLATQDDELFRENVALIRTKLNELLQNTIVTPTINILPTQTTKRSTSSRSQQVEEEKESPQNPNALGYEAESGAELDGSADGDHIDYEAVVAKLSEKERVAFMATPAYRQYLAREARLKNIKATYSTQRHASHGQSFQYTSPFAPHDPFYPPKPSRTTQLSNPLPTTLDVTGAPRKRMNTIPLPAAMGPVAPAELNERYLDNELGGQPLPAPKTSSTVKQTWHNSTAPFASFVLQPAALDLGILRKGCTYRATLSLTNTGNMTGRFLVVQPETDRADLIHLKVLYRPGLVAPGLQRRLEVELYAGTSCDLKEELVIKTEQHIFRLPLTARIVPDADYVKLMNGGVGASSPLLSTNFTVPAIHAPDVRADYTKAFPTSPLAKGKAGPFQLTSTFNQASGPGAIVQFSKNGMAKKNLPSPPRASFGSTGEIRLIADRATPQAAYTIKKQVALSNRGTRVASRQQLLSTAAATSSSTAADEDANERTQVRPTTNSFEDESAI